MKNKYLIAFFIIGTLITILGALFKIVHFELGAITGNVLLTIGMLVQIISGIGFLTKTIFNKDNEFLNR